MSQRLLKWVAVFLGLSILAGIIFLASLSLKVNEDELTKLGEYKTPKIEVAQVEERPIERPEPEKEVLPIISPKIVLQDPFVVPAEMKKNKVVHTESNPNLFDFVGIIETDNNLVAMLKVQKNQEVLLVHQGEYVTKLGIEIRKINLDSLTFYRDGKEVVLTLGGVN